MATKRKAKSEPVAGENTYDVLSKLDHDSNLYDVGDQIALDDASAAPLVAQRVIKPATETPAA